MTAPGHTLLRRWIAALGSQRAASTRIEDATGVYVSQQTLSRWAAAVMRPEPHHRPLIERASRGAVPAWSWLTRDEIGSLTMPPLPGDGPTTTERP